MSLSTSPTDEYKDDILRHMSCMQRTTWCDPNMIDLQPELEWHMRPYLLDFLVESHFGLELSAQTLFLAVNIIDRYSSKRIIYKRHYQLVGCTALWIASKYQDKKDRVPTLQELKMLCCGAYESHMFVQMESHILSTLEWTIGHPTCDLYIDINIDDIINQGYKYSSQDVEIIRNLALFACELAMFHKSLLVYSSATIATAAVALAHWIWSYSRCYNTPPYICSGIPYHGPAPNTAGVGDSSTDSCLQLLTSCLAYPSNCLERKYSRSRYCRVYQYAFDFCQRSKNADAVATPATTVSGSASIANGLATPCASTVATPTTTSSVADDLPPSPLSVNTASSVTSYGTGTSYTFSQPQHQHHQLQQHQQHSRPQPQSQQIQMSVQVQIQTSNASHVSHVSHVSNVSSHASSSQPSHASTMSHHQHCHPTTGTNLPYAYATGLAGKDRSGVQQATVYYDEHPSGYMTPPFTPEEGYSHTQYLA
ncbi:cyclin CLN3 [Sugiyamaella lignohabitans]|uniref:Cyclin CLN3 n=1 Tax=Sugiyamaella lignohabitans TaxID=796027 RepID=A0A161HHL8_9ASCO|nr:cyclin CLN3 [Sugiyamaella lignohabitans]ANB15550.1 cyclin CLN3 [Sugiyamaella lignohabitans]